MRGLLWSGLKLNGMCRISWLCKSRADLDSTRKGPPSSHFPERNVKIKYSVSNSCMEVPKLITSALKFQLPLPVCECLAWVSPCSYSTESLVMGEVIPSAEAADKPEPSADLIVKKCCKQARDWVYAVGQYNTQLWNCRVTACQKTE